MQWLVAVLIEMLATLRCLWRFVDTQKAVVDAREVVMICVAGESGGAVCPFRAGKSCLVCREMFSNCPGISESWRIYTVATGALVGRLGVLVVATFSFGCFDAVADFR